MIGKTRENWLCYLDQNDYHTYLVLVSEEEVRRAYTLYREGRVLEAAQVLKKATAVAYEVPEELWDDLVDAVPDMAWRAKGFPLREDQVINERAGEPVLILRGEPYEKTKMPVGVISDLGWDHGGRTELHQTLTIGEEFLETAPIDGFPE